MEWRFEWDESKSARCFRERGFDFAYASQVFLDPSRLEFADTRWDYGEPRTVTMGRIDRFVFVVVHTRRETRTRIISARRASRQETKLYEQPTPKRH